MAQHDYDFESIGSDSLKEFENKTTRGTKSEGKRPAEHSVEYGMNPGIVRRGFNSISLRRLPMSMFARFGMFGKDNQTKVDATEYPYRCIVRLTATKNGGGGQVEGTGFFISKRCIITAAHNIFFEDGFAKQVEVTLSGKDKSAYPLGKAVATTLRCMKRYAEDRDNPVAGNYGSDYDYGAVILPDDKLFDIIGSYFGYDTPCISDTGVEVAGYPTDSWKKKGSQYKAEGEIKDRNDYQLYYTTDTEGGQSGSPVLIPRGGDYVVAGVHYRDSGKYNQAICVNEKVMAKWNEWSKIT